MEGGNSARSQTDIVLFGLTLGKNRDCDDGSTVRKCYSAGGARIATPALAPKRSAGASVRTGGQTYYLLGDHLGGANVTANSSGVQISKLLYKPWGETRFSDGTTPTASHGALQDSEKMLQSGCTFTTRDTSTRS